MIDICLSLVGILLGLIPIIIVLGPIALILFAIFFPFVILKDWEGALVLRLGKYSRSLKPGMNFKLPLLDRIIKVDKRITTIDIPQQEVMTTDNIPLKIDGVVYFKVKNVADAILNVNDYYNAIALYSQTAIRDVIGGIELDKILSDREGVAQEIHNIIENDISKWGIEIISINLQHIELPESMKRAMARQAEAEREKRAVIIKSKGELEASTNIKKAAALMQNNSRAINLRTLSFISDISGDSNAELNFVIPLDNLDALDIDNKPNKKSKRGGK